MSSYSLTPKQAEQAFHPLHVCVHIRAQSLSHVQLFATPLIVASQASLSMGFPRQEYWSRLPFLTPGDVPNPGIKSTSLVSPALTDKFLPLVPISIVGAGFTLSH